MSVVVTGAAGKTGRAVVSALVAAGCDVTALVRRPASGLPVRAVVADLAGVSPAAFAGASAVYHIPPNMHPAEDALTGTVVAAVSQAGVPRFVLHSVLAPYLPAMPHHLRKARSEELLRRSGLVWTVLQPASYMQNVLPYIEQMRRDGEWSLPYSPSAPFTPVDLADVAAVAAEVVISDRHAYASYELCGPAVLTSAEMAAVVGQTLGQAVSVRQVTPTATGDLRAMFDYYDRHGLVGSPNVLRWLLGREPTDFAAMLARELA